MLRDHRDQGDGSTERTPTQSYTLCEDIHCIYILYILDYISGWWQVYTIYQGNNIYIHIHMYIYMYKMILVIDNELPLYHSWCIVFYLMIPISRQIRWCSHDRRWNSSWESNFQMRHLGDKRVEATNHGGFLDSIRYSMIRHVFFLQGHKAFFSDVCW